MVVGSRHPDRPRMHREIFCGGSFLRVNVQQLGEESLDVGRHSVPHSTSQTHSTEGTQLGENLCVRARETGGSATEDRVQHRTHSPDVRCRTIVLMPRNLGCHVHWRANQPSHFAICPDALRNAPVCELDVVAVFVGEKQVLGLDVSVHDASSMRYYQCIGKISCDDRGRQFAQVPAADDPVEQIAAFTEILHQEVRELALKEIVKLCYFLASVEAFQ
mmetsp:Transcript_21929/g.47705  ORF Transcript_21929/g.47705 Transcript_21929/m.47705 type:complete len:218 (-) Transcript_21929:162-815(-)